MIIYMVLFLALIMIDIVSRQYSYIKRKQLFVLWSGILLLFLMGLRSSTVGVDVQQYLFRYNNAADLIQLGYKSSEYGFLLITYFFHDILQVDFQIFLFFISAIIIIPVMYVIKKYSYNPFFSVIIYITLGLFTFNMSGLRQSMAISLTVLAIEEMKKRHILRFTIIILAASYMHNSAVIFFPIYFLWNYRMTRKQALLIYMAALMSLIYRKCMNPLILALMPDKYSKYNIFEGYAINPLVILVAALITLFCIIYVRRDEKLRYSSEHSLFLMMSILNVLFLIMSMNHNQIGRLAYYFMFGNIVLLPQAIRGLINKEHEWGQGIKVIVLCLCFAYFIISTPGGTLQIDNYHFFWSN